MFKNYLKIIFRNINRNKGYTLISVFGLAVGLACCIFIILWIQDELSYDRYHEKCDRIYRVVNEYQSEGAVRRGVRTSAQLAPALVQDFPEVEDAVRFSRNKYLIAYGNKQFWFNIYFADPSLFEIFTVPFIKGDPKTALSEPGSIVISEKMAVKYFGNENPIGKTISVNHKYDFQVTGVFQNIPRNSHFRFDFLRPFHKNLSSHGWGIQNYWTYILLAENASPNELSKKMPDFIEKYMGKETRYVYKIHYLFQTLTKIHLYSNLDGEIEPNGSILNIILLAAIGLFILLIACINYMNLSTARAVNRTNEVGVRKVVGANRMQLIKQFLSESIIFSMIALFFAVLTVELFFPTFNFLSGKELVLTHTSNLKLLIGLIGLALLVGLISGSYPAFFISAFKPISILRESSVNNFEGLTLRKALVVAQFVISITFIIGITIVYNQMNYIQNKKLGLNKEQVVVLPIRSQTVVQKYETIKNNFLRNIHVMHVTGSSYFPGEATWNQNIWWEGVTDEDYQMMRWIAVDYDFVETLEIELIEGRSFSKDFAGDVNTGYILNESAKRELGWDSAVGRQFQIVERGTIVGVVKDFHFGSLHEQIEPLALYLYPADLEYFYIRIDAEQISQTLAYLSKQWNELVPNQLFEYSFLDGNIDKLYLAEKRLEKLFGYVAFLSIFISCLGLFGLASYSTEQRTKEIGIRKVLGASVPNVVLILSKEFITLVLIANIIAWPVAYFSMNKWLQGFAYRTDIGLFTFILSALIAISIALMTVGYRTIKAAMANPVESLRYE
jgi:putative ABC transport system permease protein